MRDTIDRLKLDGRVDAINAMIPYAQAMGIEAINDPGGLLTVLRFREDAIGNYKRRLIHGGLIGALLEHAAILHLFMETEVDRVPKIINLSVDYLRPALAADTFARGLVIRQGRRVANVRATAWQDDANKPVAAAHAHFLLSPASRSGPEKPGRDT